MGDYHRYLAEFATGDKRKDSADKSLEAYKAASDVAVTELPPTHLLHFLLFFFLATAEQVLLFADLWAFQIGGQRYG
jgi:hypothetical protein